MSTPAVIVSHSPEASGNNVQPVIGRPTSLPRVLDVNNNMAPAHLENTQLLAGGPPNSHEGLARSLSHTQLLTGGSPSQQGGLARQSEFSAPVVGLSSVPVYALQISGLNIGSV